MILLKDRLRIEANGVKIQQVIVALVVWGRSFNSGEEIVGKALQYFEGHIRDE